MPRLLQLHVVGESFSPLRVAYLLSNARSFENASTANEPRPSPVGVSHARPAVALITGERIQSTPQDRATKEESEVRGEPTNRKNDKENERKMELPPAAVAAVAAAAVAHFSPCTSFNTCCR